MLTEAEGTRYLPYCAQDVFQSDGGGGNADLGPDTADRDVDFEVDSSVDCICRLREDKICFLGCFTCIIAPPRVAVPP